MTTEEYEMLLLEGVYRLEIMGVNPRILENLKHGEVTLSINVYGSDSVIIGLPNDDVMRRITSVEEEFNCVVYHIISERCGMNITEYMFIVLPDRENWDSDRADLESMHSVVYAYNVDDPEESHSELIEFKINHEGKPIYFYDYDTEKVI